MGDETTKTEGKNLFAVVPQTLTARPDIDATDKLIYTHLLGKYQTKKKDGTPWTFSAPSIADGTGLSERTVERRIKKIREKGILKLYGKLMNGKRLYDIYVFVPEALEKLISTADNLSVVIANNDKALNNVDKQLPTEKQGTADSLSDKMSAKSKIEKEDGPKRKIESPETGTYQHAPPLSTAGVLEKKYILH